VARSPDVLGIVEIVQCFVGDWTVWHSHCDNSVDQFSSVDQIRSVLSHVTTKMMHWAIGVGKQLHNQWKSGRPVAGGNRWQVGGKCQLVRSWMTSRRPSSVVLEGCLEALGTRASSGRYLGESCRGYLEARYIEYRAGSWAGASRTCEWQCEG
jgi:hypothetical protein